MANLEKNITLRICQGSGCLSANSKKIFEALETSIKEHGIEDKVSVKKTGCHGFCQQGPIVVVSPEDIFYGHVKPKDAETIIVDHILKNKPIEKLMYKNPETNDPIPNVMGIPLYKYQTKIVLRNCGVIDPESIDEYIAQGGYLALKKALTHMSPIQVIEEISKSGLRGRGGGGFPTGKKWKFCYDVDEQSKYMICNADEGDPGAFMDRCTLEGDPHSVLEGIVIAGYAIGASTGYIYIRAEYPVALERFRLAVDSAHQQGYLGYNIFNTDFDFTIEVVEGAGAFVCGEETALIASIMGKRGVPKPRPPYPATSGVWGKPTIINNVKTMASVPVIINKGADWYSSFGTEKSKGTAVFALTGKITNSGLVEVPMGTSLRKIIFDIGGGPSDGKEFKAVQTGGPSGGCLPKEMLDLPANYEALTKAGSIMGSGGMVIMDNDTCMVDIARFFLKFTQAESCGKCTPCRTGTKVMLDKLIAITEGNGKEEDIQTLKDLAITIKDASLCGLGQTAPNPVLTTLRYFEDEYLTHIREKRCPAKACKALIQYEIDPDTCIGCGICLRNCPVDAISGERREVHVIDKEKCIVCSICFNACPQRVQAVKRIDRYPIKERA